MDYLDILLVSKVRDMGWQCLHGLNVEVFVREVQATLNCEQSAFRPWTLLFHKAFLLFKTPIFRCCLQYLVIYNHVVSSRANCAGIWLRACSKSASAMTVDMVEREQQKGLIRFLDRTLLLT